MNHTVYGSGASDKLVLLGRVSADQEEEMVTDNANFALLAALFYCHWPEATKTWCAVFEGGYFEAFTGHCTFNGLLQ